MAESTNTTEKNIVIQGVTENTMTLTVQGEVFEIKNQLSELKELLAKQNVSNITYENKIYNIGHINEANFGVVVSTRVFNGVLIKELMLLLKSKEYAQEFFNSLPQKNKNNWESDRTHLKDAQEILENSFIWIIGRELRRLFAIGNAKDKSIEAKIDEYINNCFATYRDSLLLINYLFISKLWDEKNKNKDLEIKSEALNNFFNTTRELKLAELRSVFQSLIEIFRDNKLELPLEDADLGDINEFLQPDSKFNKACSEIEKLEEMDPGKESFGLGHCHTAEISLTTILSAFIFLANYELVTMKKIEYEASRNTAARYIKDLIKLENKESKNILKYDNTPQLTYSVFLRNEDRAINLFPFLLDYNALTNQPAFQLIFYQCREGECGLRYFSIENEKKQVINYLATAIEPTQNLPDDRRIELQRNIRLDLVTKQFEEAMNTILGTNIIFKPKVTDRKADSLSNL